MNLIFQAWTGPVPVYVAQSRMSLRRYAEEIGAEYRFYSGPFWRHDGQPEPNRYFSTFAPFYEDEWGEFGAMLYVDCDCLAARSAPDVFEENAGVDFGMVRLLAGPCRPGKADSVREHARLAGSPREHANAGVVLWSRDGAAEFAGHLPTAPRDERRLQNGDWLFGGNDQALLNRWGNARGMAGMDCRWNYHLGQFIEEPRFGLGAIIHYHSQARGLIDPDYNSANVWK